MRSCGRGTTAPRRSAPPAARSRSSFPRFAARPTQRPPAAVPPASRIWACTCADPRARATAFEFALVTRFVGVRRDCFHLFGREYTWVQVERVDRLGRREARQEREDAVADFIVVRRRQPLPSKRATITVMLSGPPFSFARSISFLQASSRSAPRSRRRRCRPSAPGPRARRCTARARRRGGPSGA